MENPFKLDFVSFASPKSYLTQKLNHGSFFFK
jgi:hypothetical protein